MKNHYTVGISVFDAEIDFQNYYDYFPNIKLLYFTNNHLARAIAIYTRCFKLQIAILKYKVKFFRIYIS